MTEFQIIFFCEKNLLVLLIQICWKLKSTADTDIMMRWWLNISCVCMQMSYTPPSFLEQRYSAFEERWELRDQYIKITGLMETNQSRLMGLSPDHKNYERAQDLLKEMSEFRLWSWREVDRDDYFYGRIKDFDRRTFILMSSWSEKDGQKRCPGDSERARMNYLYPSGTW